MNFTASPRMSDSGNAETPAVVGALASWILATSPRAVAYATSLLRDRERAEDVVQDCYCRLLAKAETYDLPRDGMKLLFRSISNACMNAKVRKRWMFSLSGKADRGDVAIVDRSAAEPSTRLENDELRAAISRGLDRLPVSQRAALELKSLGHSHQEIGEILETTPSHAGVLVHRARKTMEIHLASFLGKPES